MRVLYHLPLSPYARKVRLALAEKSLGFEMRVEKPWERRPGYLAINPSGSVPSLVEENGLAIPDSTVICEYLDEAYPDMPLMGHTLADRVEVRRIVAWLDGKFSHEVTWPLYGEKIIRRMSGSGQPDTHALRLGFLNLKTHLVYIGWLAETRKWLAGNTMTLADLAAAAHLSTLDFCGDVDWASVPAARDWYARMKSRPSFRPILSDRVPGVMPPAHYADLDF